MNNLKIWRSDTAMSIMTAFFKVYIYNETFDVAAENEKNSSRHESLARDVCQSMI